VKVGDSVVGPRDEVASGGERLGRYSAKSTFEGNAGGLCFGEKRKTGRRKAKGRFAQVTEKFEYHKAKRRKRREPNERTKQGTLLRSYWFTGEQVCQVPNRPGRKIARKK